MKIYVTNDHTGVEMKKEIVKYLKLNNHTVIDMGTNSSDPVSYADYGFDLAQKVVKEDEFGIAICGTGIGISIAANKVKGARTALVYEEETTRLSRQHNDANILATGARIIAPHKAVELVKVFLHTEFEGGRHTERVERLNDYNG